MGDARLFTFARPIHPDDKEQTDSWKKKVEEWGLEGNDLKAANAFFEIGGWLLFDGFLRLVEVQACLPGKGMRLRQGQRLRSCKPLIEALGDRLDRTTITRLMKTKFAWVLPGEQIAGMKPYDTGAFVYV